MLRRAAAADVNVALAHDSVAAVACTDECSAAAAAVLLTTKKSVAGMRICSRCYHAHVCSLAKSHWVVPPSELPVRMSGTMLPNLLFVEHVPRMLNSIAGLPSTVPQS